MLIPIVNTKKHELTISLMCHITSWYVKCAIPISIDVDWCKDARGNRLFTFSIDFLCFGFYIEYWNWEMRNE